MTLDDYLSSSRLLRRLTAGPLAGPRGVAAFDRLWPRSSGLSPCESRPVAEILIARPGQDVRAGAFHDPDQAAHRPDIDRLRDRDPWRLGGDAMGRGHARLPARTRRADHARRRDPHLPALGPVRMVVSFRGLCAARLRQGGEPRGGEWIPWLRRRDLRLALARAPEGARHHLWIGALGPRARDRRRRTARRQRRVPRHAQGALSSPCGSRTCHGLRADAERKGRRAGRPEALEAWLARKGLSELQERFGTRLDGLSRAIARIERNSQIEIEILALLARYLLASIPPVAEGDDVGRAQGRERFEWFTMKVAEAFREGRGSFGSGGGA